MLFEQFDSESSFHCFGNEMNTCSGGGFREIQRTHAPHEYAINVGLDESIVGGKLFNSSKI